MTAFKFSVGPWNIHEGRDVFGPEVRSMIPFAEKLKKFKSLGFDGLQLHDDDAVPRLNDLSADELRRTHAYWQACNYLALGMIYLVENPLLREPLR